MQSKKPTILVTGGTGFIGSHTSVELLKAGFDVIIVDDLSNSDASVVDRIEKIAGKRPNFFKVDLKEWVVLKETLQGADIQAIVHFAAFKAVGESVSKPIAYYKNNLLSLIHIIDIMKTMAIHHLVFSSSSTVYGQPDELPVTESTPLKPAQSPYGKTKQMCEDIIRDACEAEKTFNAISLRYFNPTGADESGLIGELPSGIPNNLVPFITQTAAGIRGELFVYGNDYDTEDGTAIRDYIHVTDLASAHIAALKRMLSKAQKKNYEVFNVGTGNGHSVMEVINSFERVNNTKVPFKIVGRRPGDVMSVYADTSLANRELNWKAIRTLDDMLRSAWVWQTHLMNYTPNAEQ